MSYTAHTEEDEETGLVLRIESDDDGGADDPTEGDEAVYLAILHRRYQNPAKSHGLNDQEALEAFERDHCNPKRGQWAAFPLYLYDHSGTAYSVSEGGNPFSCPWDSGRVGTCFVSFDGLGLARTMKRADKRARAFKAAQGMCEAYTSWANGEVYGYVIEDDDGEHLDSCWGFIGDPSGYVLEEGRAQLAWYVEEAKRQMAAEVDAGNAAAAREMEAARPDMYA